MIFKARISFKTLQYHSKLTKPRWLANGCATMQHAPSIFLRKQVDGQNSLTKIFSQKRMTYKFFRFFKRQAIFGSMLKKSQALWIQFIRNECAKLEAYQRPKKFFFKKIRFLAFTYQIFEDVFFTTYMLWDFAPVHFNIAKTTIRKFPWKNC